MPNAFALAEKIATGELPALGAFVRRGVCTLGLAHELTGGLHLAERRGSSTFGVPPTRPLLEKFEMLMHIVMGRAVKTELLTHTQSLPIENLEQEV